MRTWSGDAETGIAKLRWPAAVPYLFASLTVAITLSLIGAIVAELADRRRSRHWRHGCWRVLLWSDHSRYGRRLWPSAILASGLIDWWIDRTRRRAANGDAALNREGAAWDLSLPRQHSVGAGLPLSSETVAPLPARPILWP